MGLQCVPSQLLVDMVSKYLFLLLSFQIVRAPCTEGSPTDIIPFTQNPSTLSRPDFLAALWQIRLEAAIFKLERRVVCMVLLARAQARVLG